MDATEEAVVEADTYAVKRLKKTLETLFVAWK